MNGDGAKRYMEEAGRRGMSLRAAAKAAGVDAGVLCRMLKATYAGDVEAVDAKCERALDALAGPAVIDTRVVAGCRKLCAATYAGREVAMVWGPTQCGKTTALRQCCRENPEYKMFRFPSTPGMALLAEAVARAYGVWDDGLTFQEARRRIFDNARDTLLIADEAHEAFVAYGQEAAKRSIEFLRDIFDTGDVGLVLCGTDVLPRNMQGGKFAQVMSQTLARGNVRRAFGAVPDWRDVEKAAAYHGIAEALDERGKAVWQQKLRGMSFGAMCRLLRSAARSAAKRGKPMGWERVAEALATLDQFAAAE